MSSSEKSSTKIVVEVIGGLILAGILYVCRHWLFSLLGWLAGILRVCWLWITSPHQVAGWILFPLCVAALLCLAALLRSLRSRKPQPLHWRQFTEFEYLGVLWRWQYTTRGEIHSLVTFCPAPGCDMQTFARLGRYFGPGQESTRYPCDRCGHTPEIEGGEHAIESRVTREIQRLLRSDAWRQHMRRTV